LPEDNDLVSAHHSSAFEEDDYATICPIEPEEDNMSRRDSKEDEMSQLQSEEGKMSKNRAHVINELVTTEKKYIEVLNALKNHFKKPLSGLLTHEIDVIFPRLDVKFH
jgi:predicted  nucleic acid-binding Zn-ribbon protein